MTDYSFTWKQLDGDHRPGYVEDKYFCLCGTEKRVRRKVTGGKHYAKTYTIMCDDCRTARTPDQERRRW